MKLNCAGTVSSRGQTDFMTGILALTGDSRSAFEISLLTWPVVMLKKGEKAASALSNDSSRTFVGRMRSTSFCGQFNQHSGSAFRNGFKMGNKKADPTRYDERARLALEIASIADIFDVPVCPMSELYWREGTNFTLRCGLCVTERKKFCINIKNLDDIRKSREHNAGAINANGLIVGSR